MTWWIVCGCTAASLWLVSMGRWPTLSWNSTKYSGLWLKQTCLMCSRSVFTYYKDFKGQLYECSPLYERKEPWDCCKTGGGLFLACMIMKLLQCLSNCALTKLFINQIYCILKQTRNNLFLFQDVPNTLELAFQTFFYRSKNSVWERAKPTHVVLKAGLQGCF